MFFTVFSSIVAIVLGCIYFGYVLANNLIKTKPILMPDKDVVMQHYMLNYTLRNTKHLATELQGGIGNQMFQYAALYGMAKNNYLVPIINEDNKLLTIFPKLYSEKNSVTQEWKNWPKYHERACCIFEYNAFTLNYEMNIFMTGFFQSWRYFDNHRDSIREQFTFHPDIQQVVESFLHDTYAKWCKTHLTGSSENEVATKVQFISIHVRRGDYKLQESIRKGYTIADEVYISKAINYYQRMFDDVVFVVVSDDIAWCKENIQDLSTNVFFSPFAMEERSDEIDLCLLSRCNHSIITTGTFGWWGAYLAAGKTVYYKNFPLPGSPLSRQFASVDYFDFQWLPL